jgi:hypothetical protein
MIFLCVGSRTCICTVNMIINKSIKHLVGQGTRARNCTKIFLLCTISVDQRLGMISDKLLAVDLTMICMFMLRWSCCRTQLVYQDKLALWTRKERHGK